MTWPYHRGVKLLHDPVRNKGTAFSEQERDQLGLRGLLPPRVSSQAVQVRRVMENLRGKPNDLERYLSLIALQDRNETLFYRVLLDHLEELMPIVYTPTVGKACQLFGHIFRRPRGLYVSAEDRGSVASLLKNWPHRDVRMIVVTDGERILGLGDLGADGMGIPIGKLSLYTACAGVPPTQCLPIVLDVGTEDEQRQADDFYLGLTRPRLRGSAYLDLVDEFITAVQAVFPAAVVQFEDFATDNAFRLLDRYQQRACVFNDDIQGTAAVTVAGLLAAHKIRGGSLNDSRILFFGAGEAGLGIGRLLKCLAHADDAANDIADRCWFFDRRGLIVQSRSQLPDRKREFAVDQPPVQDLLQAIEVHRPSILIGTSAVAGAFDESVLQAMSRQANQPIVFSLSNPTSRSECTAEEAYFHTGGRAIFAAGSPFAPVACHGRRLVSGQGNNAYVFPGLGLGLITARASRVTDAMLLAAARVLCACVKQEDLDVGRVFPAIQRIREVSARIAADVCKLAAAHSLAQTDTSSVSAEAIRKRMFDPVY